MTMATNPWGTATVKRWELEFLRENLRKIERQLDETKGAERILVLCAMGGASGKASALAEMVERMIDDAVGLGTHGESTIAEILTKEAGTNNSKLNLAQAREAGGYEADSNTWGDMPGRFTK